MEHACEICGIHYLRDDAAIEAARAGSDEFFLLYSESYIPDEGEKRTPPAAAFLQEVVSQGAGEGAGVAGEEQIYGVLDLQTSGYFRFFQ